MGGSHETRAWTLVPRHQAPEITIPALGTAVATDVRRDHTMPSFACSIPPSRSSLLAARWPRPTLLGALVGAAVALVADVAAATPAPCVVTEASDDINVPGGLRYCVDQVNQGSTDHIVIQAAHWYAPDAPLVIEHSARVSGYGRIVMPGDAWVGDSLFVVGTACPGPTCAGPVAVEIEGLELAAMGVADVRGIEVLDGHELVLTDAALYDFTRPGGEGGCVRARQQSSLEVVGSTFLGCVAADGGAVFTMATSTVVTGSTFTSNTATWNGGAISLGTSGWFQRSLSVQGSTFEGNASYWGGAIKASGPTAAVELHETAFFGNMAETRGGAVFGKGTVQSCHFEANASLAWGGGLELVEDSVVLDTTLWGNFAMTGAGLSFDGGAASASLWLEGSTVAENVALGDLPGGAGVLVRGGSVTVLNSTLSSNLAKDGGSPSYGGGLAVLDGAEATVHHTTIASNQASEGSGIYVDGASDLALRSSIVAYSSKDDCKILGGYTTKTSLDTDHSCNASLAGVDPQLDPLADNGGPTRTHWPNAPEVVDAAACLAEDDQRDQGRPANDCDMGSLEL